MESYFGSPWDFGTGYSQPPTFGIGGGMPVQPQTDLSQLFAGGLAAKGIRPDQFFQDPQAAAQAIQPQGGAGSNPWDATPVDMPGGPPVSVPGQPSSGAPPSPTLGANPNIQAEEAASANAEGNSDQQQEAKKKSFGDKLAETLKGVKMPVPPAPQKVSSPNAPKVEQIKGGELLSLLLGLQSGATAGLKPPLTLNNSLKGAFS